MDAVPIADLEAPDLVKALADAFHRNEKILSLAMLVEEARAHSAFLWLTEDQADAIAGFINFVANRVGHPKVVMVGDSDQGWIISPS